MSGRFSYIKYDQRSQNMQQELKRKFEEIEAYVDTFIPDASRAKSLLFTSLEEAYMWSGKAIRDNQIERGGDRTEEVARGEE